MRLNNQWTPLECWRSPKEAAALIRSLHSELELKKLKRCALVTDTEGPICADILYKTNPRALAMMHPFIDIAESFLDDKQELFVMLLRRWRPNGNA